LGFFFRRPLKISESGERFEPTSGIKFQQESSELEKKFSKVFVRPPPPLEREIILFIVESMINKVTILSILKILEFPEFLSIFFSNPLK
jgi:hypothetical protein